MKVEDFMIGDWVVYDGDVDYSDPVKIEGMDIAIDRLVTSDREDVGINGVSPIPLTPEILEKNGFKDGNGYCMYYRDDDENLIIHYHSKYTNYTNGKYNFINIEYGYITIDELIIKYVHELQHALRLCGIDMDIKV